MSDLGAQNVRGSNAGSSKDQQRRIGRRFPGGSPKQKTRGSAMGEARTIRHEGANGEWSSGAWAAAGRATLRALNTSSRHGPQPGVPGVPMAVSAMLKNGVAQAQNPNSDPSLPFTGMQMEPLTMGGRTRISWSNDRIRTDHLEVLIGQRLSRKRGSRSSSAQDQASIIRRSPAPARIVHPLARVGSWCARSGTGRAAPG
jgi:hypothetical protein